MLASNVRRHRTKMEVTQESLSKLAGLHRTYISNLERAQLNITLETLVALSNALGVPPHELLRPEREVPASN